MAIGYRPSNPRRRRPHETNLGRSIRRVPRSGTPATRLAPRPGSFPERPIMTGVMSILEFVAQTKAIEHDLQELGPAIVARACHMLCDEMGSYHYDWKHLQPD